MANGHGGYRKPANPAPVSGPGALSKRTDGGPGHHSQVMSVAPDQPYGAMSDQMNQQRQAPMGAAAPLPPAAPVAPGGAPAAGGAPAPYAGGDFAGATARPGEPVTHGVDIGPGAGPEALAGFLGTGGGTAQGTGQVTQLLQRLSATDTTGVLAQLYQAASVRGA